MTAGLATHMGQKPYHRLPHTVGATEKQRRIWEKFRKMNAFSGYDNFLGAFEIDSDSLYQSILNLVFECAEDGSPDEALVKALDTLPEFREIRRFVYQDPINAGLSFLGIMPTVIQILLACQGDGGGDDGDGEGDGEGSGGKSLQERIKEYVEGNKEQLGDQIGQGDKGDALGGFDLDSEGSEIEVLNQLLNPQASVYTDIKKIMKALGSMIVSANAAIRDKRKNVPGEVAGVTKGRDLARLMADGWMMMGVPELEDLFWAEWAREDTRIMQIKGRERTARGPLVVLVDESGSMGAEFEGLSAHEWARAILLTMCHIAQREGRKVQVVKFSSSARTREIRSTKRGVNAQDFIWLTGRPQNGGTNFIDAFHQGFTAINQMKKEDEQRADMVVLTDCEIYINDYIMKDMIAMKEKTNTQVFGVLLSPYPASAERLGGLVDEFHTVASLSDVDMLISASKFVVEK